MNLASQNALLKTLEEPPQDSLIILIAASVGGLIADGALALSAGFLCAAGASEVAQYSAHEAEDDPATMSSLSPR